VYTAVCFELEKGLLDLHFQLNLPALNEAGEEVANAPMEENESKVPTAAIPLTLVSLTNALVVSVGVLRCDDDKLESLPGLVMVFGVLPKLMSSKSSLDRDLYKVLTV
jgi:hypothetical protein